jgi:hypothetical protein
MTITVTQIKSDGKAETGGTVIGSQTIAAPASWTRLTTLGVTPPGGAQLSLSSDAEAFRYAIIPPVSQQDTGAADIPPMHNGEYVPFFGAGSGKVEDLEYGPNCQVWVKQA